MKCQTTYYMDLMDIDRTFHTKRNEYIFFLSAPETFSRINQILGYKYVSENMSIVFILSIFTDLHKPMLHNGIKLEIKYSQYKIKLKLKSFWTMPRSKKK